MSQASSVTSILTARSLYPKVLDGLLTSPRHLYRARQRFLCRTDLYFLLRYGLERPDADNDWVFNRCREIQSEPNERLDLWAREHYKSTIITFAKTIQDILQSHGDDPLPEWEGKECTVGIFSHTRPTAKAFLRQIKVEFERNARLKEWFPDILWEDPHKESPKWAEDEGIVVKRRSNPKEATVEAWGLVDGQPTSKHFVIMAYDDIVTRESVTTPDMIKKTTEAWELSRNLGAEGGFSRYIGTRYHYFDTYATMMQRGIKPRIHRATVDGSITGVPVFMTAERLRKKYDEMRNTFYAQMLMEPRATEDAYYRPDWFKRYTSIPKGLAIYGASDYAVTKDGGDYTVHIVVGVDSEDNIYVLAVWRAQSKPDEWVDRFIALVREWKPLQWAEPADQINKSLGPFIEKRLREDRVYVYREQFSEAGSDKPRKSRAMQARAAMGKVYLPEDAPWLPDFESELLAFPLGKNDDQADAFGLIGRMLDAMATGEKTNVAPVKKRDRWDDEDTAKGSWKTI